jgi:Tol biopolymer transport system component
VGPAVERNAAIAPNGRLLAYNSDESGRQEVYVRPYPDVSARRSQISTNTLRLFSESGLDRNFDVTSDGERFLFFEPADSASYAEPVELVLLQNWDQELIRLVPQP